MQANEFEKQVQQKMDELSFTPSAPVWENVEKEIRKKKQKRRMLLWLPLFALLLTGSIVWVSLFNKNSTATDINTAQTQDPKQNNQQPGFEIAKTSQEENISTDNEQQKSNNSPSSFGDRNNSTEVNETINVSSVSTRKTIAAQKSSSPGSKKFRQQKDDFTESISEQSSSLSDTRPQPRNNETDKSPNLTPQAKEAGITGANDNAESHLKSEHHTKAVEDSLQIALAQDSLHTKETGSKIEIKKKIASGRWMLIPVLQAGVAGVTKQASVHNGARYSDPLLNSGNGPIADNSISRPTNGFAMSFGLLAQKQLSKRLHFETGLQYNYLSTTVDVGRRRNVDTVVSNQYGMTRVTQYYEKSAENSFNNKYHFISLPVALNLKLFTNTPVFVRTGMSVQHLISSNALVYSSQNRVYYHDKKAFNRTQFSTDLGIYYQLGVNKKTLTLGPNVQYNWTRLQKDNSPFQHLFSAGVRATFNLSN